MASRLIIFQHTSFWNDRPIAVWTAKPADGLFNSADGLFNSADGLFYFYSVHLILAEMLVDTQGKVSIQIC